MSVSTELVAKATLDFPATAAAKGSPTLHLFSRGPLEAARLFFAVTFDHAPTPIPGITAIRQWDTLSPIFGPLVFFAVLTGSEIVVMDYLYDPDYWDIVNDDPKG